MTEQPYDFARERYEAEAATETDWVWIGGTAYDRLDLPDPQDLT